MKHVEDIDGPLGEARIFACDGELVDFAFDASHGFVVYVNGRQSGCFGTSEEARGMALQAVGLRGGATPSDSAGRRRPLA